MIVSCPACSARYRIDPGKIKGRGAKITCPRCGHKFVVYKDRQTTRSADPPTMPMRTTSEILNRDFRRVGVTWRVRKAMGVTYSFHDLQSLLTHIEEGRVEGQDSLSYDAHTWVPIDSIGELEPYFEDIWRKAERGEIGAPSRSGRAADSDEDEEGPTTIMGHGHALMDDIRKAVAEATTPPPTPTRSADPLRTPRPALTREPSQREVPADDPTTFSRRSPLANAGLTPSSSDIRAHAPQLAGSPYIRTPTPRPASATPSSVAPNSSNSAAERDNMMVLLTTVVALVAVLLAAGWGLWFVDVLQFGSPEAPPAVSPTTIAPTSTSPAMPAPSPAPAPGAQPDPAATPPSPPPGEGRQP